MKGITVPSSGMTVPVRKPPTNSLPIHHLPHDSSLTFAVFQQCLWYNITQSGTKVAWHCIYRTRGRVWYNGWTTGWL